MAAQAISTVNNAARAWQRRGTVFGHAIAFALPCLTWVEFNLVGRLFLPELILTALLPILIFMRGQLLLKRLPATVICLAVIWLVAQMTTDLIVQSTFEDYSRGWAKIGFTVVNFMALYLLLYGDRTRLVLFALGMGVGGILTFRLNPNPLALADPWKFALGGPITLLVVAIATWPVISRIRLLPVFIIGGIGAISLYLDSRALAGCTFMTSIYVLLQVFTAKGTVARPRTVLARIGTYGGLILAAYAVVAVYSYTASEGLLGVDAYEKYREQTSTTVGLLIGGRPEVLVSGQAIIDSPIVGHGSWAKDPKYSAMLNQLVAYGFARDLAEGDLEETIPEHSHLLGAWVESGFLGIFLWLWVFYLAVRVLLRLSYVKEPLSPLIAYIALTMAWDILFSPFGAERRLFNPYFIIVLIFAWETLRFRASEAPPLAARNARLPTKGFRQAAKDFG